MVLGTWSRENTLYGRDGYSVVSNGDLAAQLDAAIRHLPELAPTQAVAADVKPEPTVKPPPDRHLVESSLFIGADKVIRQIEDGKAEPVGTDLGFSSAFDRSASSAQGSCSQHDE